MNILEADRITILPYQADFTIWLDPNSKHKTQGCVHFPRKSYVLPAKIPELVVPPQTAEIFNAFKTCFSAHWTRP